MRRPSRQDAAAKNLVSYFAKRAKKGHPEARRDWLYGPAHIPPGAYDQDAMLDDVIRRAKRFAADDGFELIYVYDAPPCWTIEPSDYVRDKAQAMEFMRNRSAHERWAICAPSGSANQVLASWIVGHLDNSIAMLKVPGVPPVGDPVLARILRDGIAN